MADPSMITTAESSSLGIVGVWANKYKMQNYSGPLWKVRRTSDNALQDCYSTAEVTTFIGGGDAYVHTWYDQSGHGYNFTETDTSIQPRLIVSDTVFAGSCLEFNDNKGMTGAYTDSGNSDSTYAVTYARFATGNRVLAGSNNWLVGPYFDKSNLYAGAFADGPALATNTRVLNVAWRSASGQYNLRVNGSAAGGSAGSTNPGTIHLARRGQFSEYASSKVQAIIFAKPITTNNTTQVSTIEQKLLADI